MYDNLQPGGWIEFQEAVVQFRSIDSSLEGTSIEKWNRYIREGARRLGRDCLAPFRCRDYISDAGFQNVTQKKFVIPASPWAKGREEKVLGAWQMKSNLAGLGPLTMWVFTKGLDWKPEDVEAFMTDVRKDMTDRSIHAFWTL